MVSYGTPSSRRTSDTVVVERFLLRMLIGRVPSGSRGRGLSTCLFSWVAMVLSSVGIPAVAQQPPASPGASAGVYSAAQARRGEAQYRVSCATCHGVDLRGSEGGNPLLGRAFRNSLLGNTVGDLYEKLRTTMPEDNPGALRRAAYADLIAYLLEVNGYPAGAGDLVPDTAALNRIEIDKRPDRR